MLFLIPLILFILLFAPYMFVIPGNDGNLEFSEAIKFQHAASVYDYISFHPPFKSLLFNILFEYGGYAAIGFVGLVLGAIGIYALYCIAKKFFNTHVALLSGVLLALSGLYIAVGLFSINDFVMTVMILCAFAFYVYKKYSLYSMFAIFAVLTKETAIFFALSVLFVELVLKRKFIRQTFYPLIALAIWMFLVHTTGREPWNDWNFSSTADKGSIYTMYHNLMSFGFLNKYAYQNWLHLFVFNFNWVFWIFAIIGFIRLKKTEIKHDLLVIGFFFLTFIIVVLSFQTYTINRYVLPLLPFVYLFAAYGVYSFKNKLAFVLLILMIAGLSLHKSIDPVSNVLFPKKEVLGESIYHNEEIDGGDGITYNRQYLFMMDERTKMLREGNCNVPGLLKHDKNTLMLLNIPNCVN